jgi:hypothetical protein
LLMKRTEPTKPQLADVRDAVVRAWTREQERAAIEQQYAELRGKYAVTIERAASSGSAVLGAES